MGKFVVEKAADLIADEMRGSERDDGLAERLAERLDSNGLLSMEPTPPSDSGMWNVPDESGSDHFLVTALTEQSEGDVMLIDVMAGISIPMSIAQAEALAVSLASASLKSRQSQATEN